MENTAVSFNYALMFLPLLIVFALILIYKAYEPAEKTPKPETHEKEIDSHTEKAKEASSEIEKQKDKIDSLKEELSKEPVEHIDRSSELSSLDQQICEYHKEIENLKDNSPEHKEKIETAEQASEYINSLTKKVISLIFIYMTVSQPLYAAKPLQTGEYYQVTAPSVVMTVDEVENIRVSIQNLKGQNTRLASLTALLQKKIDILESEKKSFGSEQEILNKDLSIYKKLVSEYETTLVKFTEQTTELEKALDLSKKDIKTLNSENEKLNKKLSYTRKKGTVMNYFMFILGAVIFNK